MPNHLSFYNGKIFTIQDDDKKAEFRYAAMRVVDNAKDGYVLTPKGKIYHVSRYSRGAKLLSVTDGNSVLADMAEIIKEEK